MAELRVGHLGPDRRFENPGIPIVRGAETISGRTLVNDRAISLVPLETRNPPAYLIPFDNTNGFVAGIAVANTTAVAGNIGITIRDDGGTLLSSSMISLGGDGHTAFVLPNNYPVAANKRGTVEVDAPARGQICALGIQYNTATQGFSTIPTLVKQ